MMDPFEDAGKIVKAFRICNGFDGIGNCIYIGNCINCPYDKLDEDCKDDIYYEGCTSEMFKDVLKALNILKELSERISLDELYYAISMYETSDDMDE